MRVGFIGLGNMGQPMAANILDAGHTLTIHDTRRRTGRDLEAAGASWAEDPRAVAARSEVVLTSLPDTGAVEQVALCNNGVFSGLAGGSTYVDTSTIAPSAMRRISAMGTKRGLHVLDAPVSGGIHGATDAALTLFVGGDAEDLERARPVLEAVGNRIVHVGPAGSGHEIKLINNLMMFVNFLGACEGVAMSARAGIDLRLLLDTITSSMGQSRIFERTVSLFLNSGRMGSTTDLAAKDMRLGVELGSELGVPMEVSRLVRDLIVRFRDAGDRGQGEFTDMIPDLLRRSGVDV
ncbi:MAG: NAD(P)-dependent oxidoreductase [Gemmatimonadota bacterium]|nr:NAD(P)-dependent oxidoreductase [Gemmatimonadota bacterium]